MIDQADFYFAVRVDYDPAAARKLFKPAALEPLRQLRAALEALPAFDEPSLEDAFKAVMDATGLKLGKIAQPVRLALTGRTASPGIFETIEALGREKTLERLARAIQTIEASAADG